MSSEKPAKSKLRASDYLVAYAKALKLLKVEGEVIKYKKKSRHEHHPHKKDWDYDPHTDEWTY